MLSDEDHRVEYLGTNPPTDLPILLLIFISFTTHSLIFYLLPSSLTPYIKSYIISTIHACVCVISVCIFYIRSSIDLTQVNRILGGGIKGTNDETMTYNICYTSGYFFYDLLVLLCFKSVRTRSALIHHITILIAGISGVYTHVAHASHFLMLAEELSTIPLNFKTIYHERPNIRDFFARLFVVTFFLSRLIYGSIICSYTFRAVPKFIQMASNLGDRTSILFVIGQVLLFILTRILNLYWTVLIIRKMNAELRHNKLSAPTNDIVLNKKAL
ncbi:unnamed protein product [Adineta steineri]|uniref:TLC domain-containing protein n=1 Tax=Adineta steineri TaxID=433720 RepID=A0A815QT75_9BILA|nr:unnamed protein product [Adineta steineri]CAF1467424.1 unnamed protein product [Adineta steineri]CAF3953637.1 unnamed protein product [Adineta steineri]CAF4122813.1 unnamed protein product [Adineta steineri]